MPRQTASARTSGRLSATGLSMPRAPSRTSRTAASNSRSMRATSTLVMGPRDRGSSVPFRVTIDGEPLGGSGGSDVDPEGSGVLTQQRMHQLVRQQGPIVDRRFAIEFLDGGAEGFAFTFG